MITRRDMFEPLLVALPGFHPTWQAFVDEWTDNPNNQFDGPGELPNYLLLGDLARYLLELVDAGRTSDVERALRVVERWLLEGDPYVKEAATLGFIETLQNNLQHTGVPEAPLVSLLGPEGRLWWNKVNAFWDKGERLVDERPMPPAEQDVWKASPSINWTHWQAPESDTDK
jgi:hypothetical protein